MAGHDRAGRTAAAIYRVALRLLLPRAAREAWGEAAEADVRRAVADARRERGGVAAAWALLRALADLAGRAPGEWLRGAGRRRGGRTGTLVREMRSAARSLARRPGFAATAVGTLALAIAANVAIFAVVHAVLIEPLPYPESEDIVRVVHHAPGLDLPELETSPGLIRFYRLENRSFESFGASDDGFMNLGGAERPARLRIARLTPSMFDVLRVAPARGRAFTEEEGRPGGPEVAILSHRTWRERFGGDPDVLGRTVELDGTVREVVGVMPPDFRFPHAETEVYLPLTVGPDSPFGEFGREAFGRLAPGVEPTAAQAELAALTPRITEYFPGFEPDFFERAGWAVTVEPYRDALVSGISATLWVVLGAVGFLLLIACANVANLFLVRAEGRQREIAVRAALGAGRLRLAVAFLSESLVVALVAGAAALALGGWGLDALVRLGPSGLPRLHEVGMDGTVLLFTLAVSAGAGFLFGSLPVLRYLGASFGRVLRDGGRGTTGGRRGNRTRALLVVTQLALALVLLAGSGLMLRSFQALRSVDLGFEPEGVLDVRVSAGRGMDRGEIVELYTRMVEEAVALPGVRAAGALNVLPLDPQNLNGSNFTVRSRPPQEDDLPKVAYWALATPGAFEALGMPVVEGRAPTWADERPDAAVAWVNETFARRFLEGRALGEGISLGGGTDTDTTFLDVVGVVGDARFIRPEEEPVPMLFMPFRGPASEASSAESTSLLLATDGDPLALAPAVRERVAGLAPDMPITETRTMERVVADSMALTSFIMTLLVLAAGVTLVLGTVGVYGVVSYVVSRRTREIGVRMALGARAADVRRMMVRQGMATVLLGVAVGVLAALGATRALTSLLFEVSPTDPATFAAVALLLVGVAGLASWLPAHRASRVDPTEALGAE